MKTLSLLIFLIIILFACKKKVEDPIDNSGY